MPGKRQFPRMRRTIDGKDFFTSGFRKTKPRAEQLKRSLRRMGARVRIVPSDSKLGRHQVLYRFEKR